MIQGHIKVTVMGFLFLSAALVSVLTIHGSHQGNMIQGHSKVTGFFFLSAALVSVLTLVLTKVT
jgi:hypothetical protein